MKSEIFVVVVITIINELHVNLTWISFQLFRGEELRPYFSLNVSDYDSKCGTN
jgi:hypothetical protein